MVCKIQIKKVSKPQSEPYCLTGKSCLMSHHDSIIREMSVIHDTESSTEPLLSRFTKEELG